ncbi:MAG: hypothetical protein KKA42_05835 [candidate division Zixibacteria bacterium]|nr:hypothetical protein [candidate division Zixibacteria bacterium]
MNSLKPIVISIGRVLLIVVILPLVLVIGLPMAGVMAIRDSIAERRFRRREMGRLYLLCSSRRNWYDFLNNNVSSHLPDNCRIIWVPKTGGRDGYLAERFDSRHLFRPRMARPCLALVTSKKIFHTSLHAEFKELKSQPRKSEETRRACAEVINRGIEDLETQAGFR